VINAPFNPQARALIARYIARIFADFDQSDPGLRFDSVRVGGGVQGELRYPPAEWNGHANSYWAFDVYAQDPTLSGIPSTVIGWRPGIDANPGTTGRGQLIVNPGFEDSRTHYPVLAWSPDDEVVAQLVSADVRSGTRALALTISTPNRIHQYVGVTPGATYRVGGWLKRGPGTGRARLFTTQYDASWHLIPGAPFVKLENAAPSWVEQSGLLTTSATTRYLKIEMDGDTSGTFYFDDLWLVRDGDIDQRTREIDVPVTFYDWYVGRLTSYQNWQITEIRKHFAGQLDVLYAGKGLRPVQITDALTNDLRGTGWSEKSRALYAGAAYKRHVEDLATSESVALYVTGIDEPTAEEVNDNSPYPGDWSAARWIAHLAGTGGLPVWGENSGQDDVSRLLLSAQRAHASRFIGLMWGFESELYTNPGSTGYATIEDYERVILFYSGRSRLFLPLINLRR
jgi:hypothetical protein